MRDGGACRFVNISIDRLPILAIVQFHDINKTIKNQDPFKNVDNDTMIDMVKTDILTNILFAEYKGVFLDGSSWLHWQGLYFDLYQRQSVNESDFIIEIAWIDSGEKFVPDFFKRLFVNTVNVSIPVANSSAHFEARLITNFEIRNGTLKIGQVSYKRTLKGWLYSYISGGLPRYLQMSPLIICNRVSLPLSDIRISNTSFFHRSSDIVVSLPDHYIITDNFIEMCADDYFNLTSQALELLSDEKHAKSNDIWDEIAKILSFVCLCISIVCLIICITTYSLFDTLRTTPGKINLCLCVSLLIAQILQQFTIDLIEYKIACTVFGVLIHFSWAATLCWMSVSSFNLFRCFSPSNIKSDLHQSIVPYAAFVVVMSALLVVANLAVNLVQDGNLGYGDRICYISSNFGLLLTFVTPVGLIVLSNLCFLSVTIWRISHLPKLKGSKSADRSNVLIYIKMSTLTGACWVFGFLGILTKIDIFEILFILTNASQGLFLMVSFVCNRRVLGLFRNLWSNTLSETPRTIRPSKT